MALIIDQLLARFGYSPVAPDGPQDQVERWRDIPDVRVHVGSSDGTEPLTHVRDVSRLPDMLQRCSCGHVTRTIEQMRQHVASARFRSRLP